MGGDNDVLDAALGKANSSLRVIPPDLFQELFGPERVGGFFQRQAVVVHGNYDHALLGRDECVPAFVIATGNVQFPLLCARRHIGDSQVEMRAGFVSLMEVVVHPGQEHLGPDLHGHGLVG